MSFLLRTSFQRPTVALLGVLAIAIYANFYTHHVMPDVRVVLFAATAFLLRRTRIHYRIWRVHRRMPLLLGLFLVALFVWFAIWARKRRRRRRADKEALKRARAAGFV